MKYIILGKVFFVLLLCFLFGCGETEDREPVIPVATLEFAGYIEIGKAEFLLTVKPHTKELPVLIKFVSEGKEPFHVWKVMEKGPYAQHFTVFLDTSVTWEVSILPVADGITKDYSLVDSGVSSEDDLSEYVLGDASKVTTPPFVLSVEPETVMIPEGMVLIPEGEFRMGSDQGADDEKPEHTVYVDAFYMDIHEVTTGEYSRFVQQSGHSALPASVAERSPTDDHPVIGMGWHDAMAYAKWAGKRLPTEAEWERAARGGLSDVQYPWGNEPPDGTQCNYADKNVVDLVWNFDGEEMRITWADEDVDDGYRFNAPVGSFLPNPYGLYDMAGNVWEWCLDEYDEDFYASFPLENPIAGKDLLDTIEQPRTIITPRVSRGGSHASDADGIRVSQRIASFPFSEYNDVGFRCVKPVKEELKKVGQ